MSENQQDQEKPISKMNKDELHAYALFRGVELDMTKPVAALREQVQAMADGKPPEQNTPKEEPSGAHTHLRHPVNKRVYPRTLELDKRGDMIPCDKDGKNV